MAKKKTAGVLAAAVGAIGLAGALVFAPGEKAPTQPARNVPKDAKHLWADGGFPVAPLPTLDDGGCQAWAQRCADGKCAGACE